MMKYFALVSASIPSLLLASAALAQNPTAFETVIPGEVDEANASAQELISQIKNDYISQDKRAFRDAHPREIGCVQATFTVDPNIPAKYQTGVYATPGKSYDAIIRFSSSLGPSGDNVKDARGMAIKIFGVSGTKLLDDQPNAVTHDFVQIDGPTFPAKNTHDFAGIVKVKSNPVNLIPFLLESPITHARELKAVLDGSSGNPNNGNSLAETQFFSMVPYLLKGPNVNSPVKFTSRPCGPVEHRTLDGTDGELRNDLQQRLNEGSLCYEFAYQFYVDGAGFDVEDGMSLWTEDKAPFTKFATITIPKQTFLTDAKLHYCDALSMQPWHAIQQHQPIGNINRARRIIYRAISQFRHQSNNESSLYAEPTDLSQWNALTDTTYSVWNAIKVPAGS